MRKTQLISEVILLLTLFAAPLLAQCMTPPTISGCPGNITINSSSGVCGATVTFSTPTATSNCSVDYVCGIVGENGTLTLNAPPGETFTGTVVFASYGTPIDGGGSCTSRFSLGTCHASTSDTVVAGALTPGSTIFSIVANNGNFTDPCVGTIKSLAVVLEVTNATPPPASIVQTMGLSSGSFFPVGTTTVTFTATDHLGNMNSCSFDVTVIDNESPSITCPSNITVSNDTGNCSALVTVPPPSVSDNCAMPPAVTNSFNGTANASGIYLVGTTTVVFTANDGNGNINTCSMMVTVLDTENPSITCPPTAVISTDPGFCQSTASIGMPSASDNCPGVMVTGPVPAGPYPLGNTTVTWTATDAAGNVATCMQTVMVVDTEDPVITCPMDMTFFTEDPPFSGTCSGSPPIGSATAVDNCSAPGAITITNDDPGTYTRGTITVTWTATDEAGNMASCGQSITVVDNTLPTLAYGPTPDPEISYALNCDPPVSLTPDTTAFTVTENCVGISALITISPADPGDSITLGSNPSGATVSNLGGGMWSITGAALTALDMQAALNAVLFSSTGAPGDRSVLISVTDASGNTDVDMIMTSVKVVIAGVSNVVVTVDPMSGIATVTFDYGGCCPYFRFDVGGNVNDENLYTSPLILANDLEATLGLTAPLTDVSFDFIVGEPPSLMGVPIVSSIAVSSGEGIPKTSVRTVNLKVWQFCNAWEILQPGTFDTVDITPVTPPPDPITIPRIVSPTPGTTLPANPVTFVWDPVDALYTFLRVGTSPGGSDLYFSPISLSSTTMRTATIGATSGSTVYVTFWYFKAGWKTINYTYTAP